MTLTVVVGSSGSGKTTFLHDVHTLHSCTYIRQYHTLRPYVPIRNMPLAISINKAKFIKHP